MAGTNFRFELAENGDYSKVWMDGEEISHRIRAFAVHAAVGEATIVTLTYIPASGGGEAMGQTVTDLNPYLE